MANLLRSPAGIAAFAHLAEPDTRGAYADNKFKVTLKLQKGDEECDAFVASLTAAAKAAASQLSTAQVATTMKKRVLQFHDPVKDGDEREGAEEKGTAGFWMVTFKSKFQPAMVDAKKGALPDTVKIFSGDIIKVAFEVLPFDKLVQNKGGVSLRLKAVQLLDKRNSGAGAANIFDEEDGYESGRAADARVAAAAVDLDDEIPF